MIPPEEREQQSPESKDTVVLRGKRKVTSEILSFLRTVAAFLVIAFLLKSTVVEAYKIPSGSMKPTLQIGDHILVSKFSYGLRLPLVTKTVFQYSTPRRGDVVVFTRPDDNESGTGESGTNIIKRVIGLPGEVVEVRDTKVYIDNVVQRESRMPVGLRVGFRRVTGGQPEYPKERSSC